MCWNLIGYEMQSASYKANCANINVLREGVAASKDSWISPNCNTNGINIRLKNFVFQKSLSLGLKTGVLNLPYLFLYGGTALLQNDNSWFHAPATSDDTTWRYDDRTIKAHSTLRIRALWKRAENSAATAAVAITDPANWYAGTKGGALAETVFPSSANDAWQESRIEWRNDSDEDAQVRVWECVSGDTAGGYLRTIEATGGPM